MEFVAETTCEEMSSEPTVRSYLLVDAVESHNTDFCSGNHFLDGFQVMELILYYQMT